MGIARSTFYYQAKNKVEEDKSLVNRIEKIILEFAKYGYRRITKHLHREGIKVNHKRVQRLLQENDLSCKTKKKFICTTDSNHSLKTYPNLLKNLIITRLNQVWVSDITYIRFLKGFVYLAVILDSFSRKVVGYAISKSINGDLALAALKMAVKKRKPIPGCIHHSDRGIQYATIKYIDYLKLNDFQISMSRKGNPYDNAKAESFMKTIKTEKIYLSEYDTYEDLLANISEFIEIVYNKKRLHSALGYLPPNEFEQNFHKKGGLDHISVILKNVVNF